MIHRLEHLIAILLIAIIGSSILLSVQPDIDIWIPLLELCLSIGLLALIIVRAAILQQFNLTPVMIPLILLIGCGGGSFFLPLITLPRGLYFSIY